MTGRVTFIDTDGNETNLGFGTIRIEVGAAIELGSEVQLAVIDGAVILGGEDIGVAPSQDGALYIDANGFLRVKLPEPPP